MLSVSEKSRPLVQTLIIFFLQYHDLAAVTDQRRRSELSKD